MPQRPLFAGENRQRPLAAPRQRPIAGIGDELEIPLHEVTFCAVDLETTSVSSKTGEIVEIGALKARGGEILGTFQTFVKPSVDLPVEIQLLTGITPSHLVDALPLPAVLPAFVEFSARTVFVAHNARFDKSFLDAACRKLDYEDDTYAIVDTARLARRLLRDEVRNCRPANAGRSFPHRAQTEPPSLPGRRGLSRSLVVTAGTRFCLRRYDVGRPIADPERSFQPTFREGEARAISSLASAACTCSRTHAVR